MSEIRWQVSGGRLTPNPGHKRRLRELLFGQEARELRPDELAAVAGGVNLPEDNDDQWTQWPEQEGIPE